MLKTLIGMLATGLLAACAIPQSQIDAVRIEGTPGAAVIYVVRSNPDLGPLPAQIVLNDRPVGASYPGTYHRIEVPAGRHRLTGYGHDSGSITIDTQAGRIYFVQQSVGGTWRENSPYSFFRVIDEARARAAMVGASRQG